MGSIVECPFWDYTRNDATKRTKLNTKTLINYWGPVIKLKCFYRMFQDVAYMWHSWVWMSQSSKVCSHRISRCVEGKTVWKCAAVASASSLSSKPAQLSAPQAHNTQSSEWIIVSLIIWGESVHPEREYFHYSLYRRVDYCTETRPKKLELSDLGLTLSIKIVEWWFEKKVSIISHLSTAIQAHFYLESASFVKEELVSSEHSSHTLKEPYVYYAIMDWAGGQESKYKWFT